jgi:hypothetical protein
MQDSPLDQDELTTLEAEYREALQRLLAAHLEALARQRELEAVMRRAEKVLMRASELAATTARSLPSETG